MFVCRTVASHPGRQCDVASVPEPGLRRLIRQDHGPFGSAGNARRLRRGALPMRDLRKSKGWRFIFCLGVLGVMSAAFPTLNKFLVFTAPLLFRERF
jgi:hypothetical protein